MKNLAVLQYLPGQLLWGLLTCQVAPSLDHGFQHLGCNTCSRLLLCMMHIMPCSAVHQKQRTTQAAGGVAAGKVRLVRRQGLA